MQLRIDIQYTVLYIYNINVVLLTVWIFLFEMLSMVVILVVLSVYEAAYCLRCYHIDHDR